MRRAVILYAALCGCSVDVALDASDTSSVLCTSNDDCPVGFCAPNGRCVNEVETSPLRLEAATASSLTTVELRFDDAVGDIGTIASYVVTPALSVIAAEAGEDVSVVVLTTDPQQFDVTYAVTVQGLTDDQGNALASDAVSTTFPSFLGLRSDVAPHFTSPVEGETIRYERLTLAWTNVAGATSYAIDLATDAAFTKDLQHFEVPGLQVEITAPSDVTYYAQVRADVTKPGLYGKLSFERLNDIVYVACSSEPCGIGGHGSRTAPFTSIAQALALAAVGGVDEVRVANRPGNLPYDEVLAITRRGVRLRGGFEPSFANALPNLAQPTTVQALANVLTVSDIGSDDGVLVEAFSFVATGRAPHAVVVRNTNVVTFDDVSVVAGNPEVVTTEAVAMSGDDGRSASTTRIIMHRAQLLANRAQVRVLALLLTRVGFELHDVALTAGASATSTALSASGLLQLSEIDHCDLRVEGATNSATAASISNGEGSGAEGVAIHDSTFVATSPHPALVEGVHLLGVPAFIDRSSIQASSLSSVYGLTIYGGATMDVRNVGVSASGTSGNALRILGRLNADAAPQPNPRIADSTFVHADGDVVDNGDGDWSLANSLLVGKRCVIDTSMLLPASFVGNMLACETLYNTIVDNAPANLTAIADVNNLNGACSLPDICPSQRRFANNAAIVAVPSDIFVAYGSGTDDLHLQASAPAAICTGGTNATAAACGSLAATPVSCGGDGFDVDGEARSAGFSFGYDER